MNRNVAKVLTILALVGSASVYGATADIPEITHSGPITVVRNEVPFRNEGTFSDAWLNERLEKGSLVLRAISSPDKEDASITVQRDVVINASSHSVLVLLTGNDIGFNGKIVFPTKEDGSTPAGCSIVSCDAKREEGTVFLVSGNLP